MLPHVFAYTDGACLGNPGPGGYGVVLVQPDQRQELAGGCPATTNNRMELLAAIVALEALPQPAQVVLFTDSQYLSRALTEGWLQRWQTNGWRTADRTPVKNVDLWQRLLTALARHRVEVRWLRGHAGHPENERADQLALAAARQAQGRAACTPARSEAVGLPPHPPALS